MSSNNYIYIGVYFKIYMPKEKYTSPQRKCIKCNNLTFDKYCSKDGNKTERFEEERLTSFYSLCKSIFRDGDRFNTGNIYNKDFVICMANSKNQSGWIEIDSEDYGDTREQELPKEDYSGDWKILSKELDEREIRYEKKFGVVSYWM